MVGRKVLLTGQQDTQKGVYTSRRLSLNLANENADLTNRRGEPKSPTSPASEFFGDASPTQNTRKGQPWFLYFMIISIMLVTRTIYNSRPERTEQSNGEIARPNPDHQSFERLNNYVSELKSQLEERQERLDKLPTYDIELSHLKETLHAVETRLNTMNTAHSTVPPAAVSTTMTTTQPIEVIYATLSSPKLGAMIWSRQTDMVSESLLNKISDPILKLSKGLPRYLSTLDTAKETMQYHPPETVMDDAGIRGFGDCYCFDSNRLNIGMVLAYSAKVSIIQIEHIKPHLDRKPQTAPTSATIRGYSPSGGKTYTDSERVVWEHTTRLSRDKPLTRTYLPVDDMEQQVNKISITFEGEDQVVCVYRVRVYGQ